MAGYGVAHSEAVPALVCRASMMSVPGLKMRVIDETPGTDLERHSIELRPVLLNAAFQLGW